MNKYACVYVLYMCMHVCVCNVCLYLYLHICSRVAIRFRMCQLVHRSLYIFASDFVTPKFNVSILVRPDLSVAYPRDVFTRTRPVKFLSDLCPVRECGSGVGTPADPYSSQIPGAY